MNYEYMYHLMVRGASCALDALPLNAENKAGISYLVAALSICEQIYINNCEEEEPVDASDLDFYCH